MTMNIEDELRAGMCEQVAGVVLTTGLVDAAGQRNRRRTLLQRGMYVTGVFGLAGALAAVLAVGGGDALRVGGDRDPVVSVAEPRLELAAAVAASENISYRMKITINMRNAAEQQDIQISEGAYDPATRSGYRNWWNVGVPGVWQDRLVNGVLFEKQADGQVWRKRPSNGKFDYGLAEGAATASADPQDLFQALRTAGVEVAKSPAGYRFETSEQLDPEHFVKGTADISGDIVLDGAGRIAKVTINKAVKGQLKPGLKKETSVDSRMVVTVELSDYGTPVLVKAPTEIVTEK